MFLFQLCRWEQTDFLAFATPNSHLNCDEQEILELYLI